MATPTEEKDFRKQMTHAKWNMQRFGRKTSRTAEHAAQATGKGLQTAGKQTGKGFAAAGRATANTFDLQRGYYGRLHRDLNATSSSGAAAPATWQEAKQKHMFRRNVVRDSLGDSMKKVGNVVVRDSPKNWFTKSRTKDVTEMEEAQAIVDQIAREQNMFGLFSAKKIKAELRDENAKYAGAMPKADKNIYDRILDENKRKQTMGSDVQKIIDMKNRPARGSSGTTGTPSTPVLSDMTNAEKMKMAAKLSAQGNVSQFDLIFDTTMKGISASSKILGSVGDHMGESDDKSTSFKGKIITSVSKDLNALSDGGESLVGSVEAGEEMTGNWKRNGFLGKTASVLNVGAQSASAGESFFGTASGLGAVLGAEGWTDKGEKHSSMLSSALSFASDAVGLIDNAHQLHKLGRKKKANKVKLDEARKNWGVFSEDENENPIKIKDKEIAAIDNKLAALKTKSDEADNKYNGYDKIGKDIISLRETGGNLSAEEERLKTFDKKITVAETNLRSATKTKSDIEAKNSEKKDELDKKRDVLKGKKEGLEKLDKKEKTDREKEIETITKEIEELEKELKEREGMTAQAETAVNTASDEVKRVKGEKDACSAKVDQLRAEGKRLHDEINSYVAKGCKLENYNGDEWNDDWAIDDEKLLYLWEKDAQSKINSLTKQKESNKAQKEKLEGKKTKLEDAKAKLAQLKTTQEAEMAATGKTTEDLRKDLKELENKDIEFQLARNARKKDRNEGIKNLFTDTVSVIGSALDLGYSDNKHVKGYTTATDSMNLVSGWAADFINMQMQRKYDTKLLNKQIRHMKIHGDEDTKDALKSIRTYDDIKALFKFEYAKKLSASSSPALLKLSDADFKTLVSNALCGQSGGLKGLQSTIASGHAGYLTESTARATQKVTLLTTSIANKTTEINNINSQPTKTDADQAKITKLQAEIAALEKKKGKAEKLRDQVSTSQTGRNNRLVELGMKQKRAIRANASSKSMEMNWRLGVREGTDSGEYKAHQYKLRVDAQTTQYNNYRDWVSRQPSGATTTVQAWVAAGCPAPPATTP